MLATLPFHIVSALSFAWIVYGMAGLRPEVSAIFEHGTVCTMLYLIAVQVGDG